MFLCLAALQEVGQDFFASGTIEKAVESYEKMLDILTRDTDTDPVDLFQGMYDSKHEGPSKR
jgi:lipopolysaccharide biosynthesis regulator YciM